MDAAQGAQRLAHMVQGESMELHPASIWDVNGAQQRENLLSTVVMEQTSSQRSGESQLFQKVQQKQKKGYEAIIIGDTANHVVNDAAQSVQQTLKQLTTLEKIYFSSDVTQILQHTAEQTLQTVDMDIAHKVQQMATNTQMQSVYQGQMELQNVQRNQLVQQIQNSVASQAGSVQVTNHLTPNISIAFGDVRESADVDEVARRLRMTLLEEMQRCGEGVW